MKAVSACARHQIEHNQPDSHQDKEDQQVPDDLHVDSNILTELRQHRFTQTDRLQAVGQPPGPGNGPAAGLAVRDIDSKEAGRRPPGPSQAGADGRSLGRSRSSVQDIAALMLTRDLRDLR